jgi:hypothetical protein
LFVRTVHIIDFSTIALHNLPVNKLKHYFSTPPYMIDLLGSGQSIAEFITKTLKIATVSKPLFRSDPSYFVTDPNPNYSSTQLCYQIDNMKYDRCIISHFDYK